MKTRLSCLLLLALLSVVVPVVVGQEPQISEDEKREFLLKAKVVDSHRIGKGITSPWRLTLNNGTMKHDAAFQSIDESKAIAAMSRGTTELNFRDSYHFNIAAYELAKLLGLGNMMPVTVERKWRGDSGALSWWIPDAMDELQRRQKKLTPPDVEAFNQQMHRMRVFAELVYDTDRNLGNVLISPDWKVWMIDFTRAFRASPDLREPKNLERCDRQLLEKLKSLTMEQVKERTKPHLGQMQLDGLMKRRDKIIEYFNRLAAEKGEAGVFY